MKICDRPPRVRVHEARENQSTNFYQNICPKLTPNFATNLAQTLPKYLQQILQQILPNICQNLAQYLAQISARIHGNITTVLLHAACRQSIVSRSQRRYELHGKLRARKLVAW